MASRELQHLKQQARQQQQQQQHGLPTSTTTTTAWDNIRICCLGQDGLPAEMMKTTATTTTKRPRGRVPQKQAHAFHTPNSTKVDPRKGLLLVVQPTCTNSHIPFYSSVNSDNNGVLGTTVPPIEALQQLLTRATICQLPSVMLSPRFTSSASSTSSSSSSSTTSSTTTTRPRYRQYPYSTTTTADRAGGLDSSGYQRSETYGGAEPPRSTPWLLRDYTPPVFAWICRSHVGLLHSVMNEGHDWHIYKKKELPKTTTTSKDYEYVASTRTSFGRPSVGIMETVLMFSNDNNVEP